MIIILSAKKKQQRQDERDRIAIEGKFRQGKRCFGLDLIKTKLAETNKTAIAITFLILNLEKLLRFFILFFMANYYVKDSFSFQASGLKMMKTLH